jgi:parallel beta-helix repeat protein
MLRKFILLFLLGIVNMSITNMIAKGTTYSFRLLSQTPGSGIRYVEGTPGYYLVEKTDTISADDSFKLDEGVYVRFVDGMSLVIEGEADFSLPEGKSTTLSAFNAVAMAKSIRINNTTGIEVRNVVFESIGLESMSKGAIVVENCQFIQHNGSSAAALYFLSEGKKSTISHCTFERCAKAAIGSAANVSQPLTISHCTLLCNSLNNQNIPQINITASNLLIDSCTILGDSTSLTSNNMVGGIGISNLLGYTDVNVTVSNCIIKHNRYGIGIVGPANVRIEDNTITDNNHEANPMNGGSGISFYDPYAKATAVVARNTIEGNIWGVTIIGCKDVNLGQPQSSAVQSPGENHFSRNGYDGNRYDIYNNSTLTIYAQNNIWGVEHQTADEIEDVIFHQYDNSSLGEVIYMPAHDGNADISLPRIETQSAAYTLQGTRMNTPNRHGLYIQNGKKIIR